MQLNVLLLAAALPLLLTTTLAAVPCHHSDVVKSMECKPLLGQLAGEMAKYPEMPPPDELKAFAHMCKRALVSLFMLRTK
uniref:DUF19 domain-containing protein n=1 Tax=Caenorhabditis japonica TaxID=281687 RepID=A0A8R1DZ63_CAEJA